ncbi:homeobox-leucine zipper protein ROC5 [Brachypodium distachyon]|uniref:Homeobox domain-containing protein n=1 Tax=Brachypodium distachyon TaxID=15368 RepID=A0A2K2CGE8_BRADI|nr:homeobox-leucine zipper protein ROC5 [Brachypodium distachyon]PNT61099.1 hypothetical protein BRADI_5g10370v3 [Brachypodium distachyon]|eukprot:XP_024311210.1 homeobox-leucine zipper protein ROC5 [Brachypodium distachyon]
MDGLAFDPNTNVGNTDGVDAVAAGKDNNVGATDSQRTATKRFKRHSRDQVAQLEAVFQQCPRPDEQVQQDLSVKLGMGANQVKFWFQNRRSAKKKKQKQEEVKLLREESWRLHVENQTIKTALFKKTCLKCGVPMVHVVGDTPEKRRLLAENAKLKNDLLHANAFLNMISGGSEGAPSSRA